MARLPYTHPGWNGMQMGALLIDNSEEPCTVDEQDTEPQTI